MDSCYKVTQLRPHFWAIDEGNVRFYLLEGTKLALLIDTGYGGGNVKELTESLTKLPVTVVNTHTDPDHVGGNVYFEHILMHPAEYDHYFYEREGRNPSVSPLWEGDVIDIGGRRLEVFLIPGHTPGSIALLDRDERCIFAGDTLQRGLIFMLGRGRSIPAFAESLKKLEALRPAFDTVYTHHGPRPEESAELVREVIEGCKMLMAGGARWTETDTPRKGKIYDCGGIMFFTEPDYK